MRRFFSKDSFWNQPIPDDSEPDARSEHCIELLKQDPAGGFHVNLYQYTIPVYVAGPETPLRRVHQREVGEREGSQWTAPPPRHLPPSQGEGFGPQLPIPEGAEPDPARDAHMAVVDWGRGTAWDMWRAGRRDDGEWESFCGMEYPLDGTGVWSTDDFPVVDGESIHCHGPSRAAGVPAIAGLIMYEEVQAGQIDHKLACATRFGAFKEFVWPAAWTDAGYSGGFPEGGVIQLDPALDLGRFDLSPAARTIARALQQYGAVNVDGAGGSVLYGEGLCHDEERTWRGLLDENELKRIPMDHYRVLELGEITPKGDARHKRT